MTGLFLRLFIIYFLAIFSIRLMGKRQIGEMQLSELVSAIFISELATYPVNNVNIPLIYGILPVLFLVSFEVVLSFLSIKCKLFQKAFDSKPSILIRKGELDQKELKKSRITLDELLSQLRLKGAATLSQVYYAILEPNGQLSVIQRSSAVPPSASLMSMKPPETGIDHAVIIDGVFNEKSIKLSGKTDRRIKDELKKHNITNPKGVFVMTIDDGGSTNIIRKTI